MITRTPQRLSLLYTPIWTACKYQTCRPRRPVTSCGGQPLPGVELRRVEVTAATEEPAEPQLRTVEVLASGAAVRTLDAASVVRRRTIADLPKDLVKRLVRENVSQKTVMKLGRRGVTNEIGRDAEQRWRTREVIKVHADHKYCKSNMKLTQQLLEDVTGGISIWCSGSRVLLYRDDEGRALRTAARQRVPRSDDDC